MQKAPIHCYIEHEEKISRKYFVAVFLLCCVLYLLFAFIISLSWMKCDEWQFVMMHKGSVRDVVHTCIGRWLHANGRLGDIVGSVLGLAETRWQHIILTPLFVVGAPFAVYALVRKRGERHLFNMRGFCFVCFFVTIMAISVNTTPWRNYYDYAAAINYLWPCTLICYFLSFFRSDLWSNRKESKYKTVFLIALGVYSGWSLECVTLFMLPFLLIWFLYRCLKKLFVPRYCFAGICGVILGAFFLVSSPGLAVRGAGELVHSSIDVSAFTFGEAFDFVCDHSSVNIQQIKGVTVDLYLKDLPLILRSFYCPELFVRYTSCCYPLIVCVCFLLMMRRNVTDCKRVREIKIALALISLSICCALSYLYGCVPRKMSYFPAIFILAIACSYLYLNVFCRYVFVCVLIAIGSILAFSFSVFPSVIEAWEYKCYEKGLRTLMYDNIKKGVKDAHIPPVTYSTPPKNKLGLITDTKHLY